jgi:uncharacterized membrane protein
LLLFGSHSGHSQAETPLIPLSNFPEPALLVNVPMNEALATVTAPTDPQAADRLWREYSGPWTWWNTLRTLFSSVSLLLVGSAICLAGSIRR